MVPARADTFQILTDAFYFRMKKIFYMAHLAECPLSEVPTEQVRPYKLKVHFTFFASLFQDPMYRFSDVRSAQPQARQSVDV